MSASPWHRFERAHCAAFSPRSPGLHFLKRGPLGRGLPPSLPATAFSCLLSRCLLPLSLACYLSQACATARRPATRVCCHGQWHWGGMRLNCQKQPNRLPPRALASRPPRRSCHNPLSWVRLGHHGAQVVVAALPPRPTFPTPPAHCALLRPRPLSVLLLRLVQPLRRSPSPRLAQPAAAGPRRRLKDTHQRRRPQLLSSVTRRLQQRPPLRFLRNLWPLRPTTRAGSPHKPALLETVHLARFFNVLAV